MPGRNRRVRLLTLSAFAFFAFLLYTRSGTPAEEYKDIFADKTIGGGSVIRPKLGDIPPQKQPVDLPEPDVPEEADVQEEEDLPVDEELELELEKDFEDDVPNITITEALEFPTETTPPPVPTPTTTDAVLQEDSAQPGLANWEGEGQGRLAVDHDTSVTSSWAHWTKQTEAYPVSTTIQLPTGSSRPFPKIQRAEAKLKENGKDLEKLAIIKDAAQHAWDGYRKNAFGADEVRPIAGTPYNPFNGWGATLVDSLDTLWIMGMLTDFEEAVKKVGDIDFTTSKRPDIPLFETTIRYLGGLLGAFDVSGRKDKYRILLDKAAELGEILYSAFDTENRMPQTFYHWSPDYPHQSHRAGTRTVMSELGSLSLEFTRLAQLTKEPKFYDAIARITNAFEEFQNNTRLPGMWPTKVDASGCGTPGHIIDNYPQPKPKQSYTEESGNLVASKPSTDRSDQIASSRDTTAKLPETDPVKGNQPGMGKIKGWDDPIDEVSGTPKSANEGRASEMGTSKNLGRRQLDSYNNLRAEDDLEPVDSEVLAEEAPHKEEARTTRYKYPDDEDICVPQGLASPAWGMEVYTLSGLSDSTYEYLPKEYLLLGGLVDQYKSMYLDSANTIIENLLYKPMTPDERDILMSGESKVTTNMSDPDLPTYNKRHNPEVAHLACFAGGMFAMGGIIFDKPEHVEIGSKLTDGCVWAYNATATGIMPEGGLLMPCPETWGKCEWNETAYYRELDPFADERKAPSQEWDDQDRPASVKASTSNPALSAAADSDEASEVVTGPDPAPQISTHSDDGALSDTLRKRTLDEYEVPSSVTRIDLNDIGSSLLRDSNILSRHGSVSHAEFVATKIHDEGLPPGFVRISGRKYILRPEAIESVFYMYRITGNPYWREVGWNMFRAIERATRAPFGAAAILDMTDPESAQVDSEESFWLAETLKYFYLLYDDPDLWSLDDWVLNTEAHFLRRPDYEYVK